MTIIDTITEQTTVAELAEILRRRGLRLTDLTRSVSTLWRAEVRSGSSEYPGYREYRGLGETASQAINNAIRESSAP